jgi:hypothetical protein
LNFTIEFSGCDETIITLKDKFLILVICINLGTLNPHSPMNKKMQENDQNRDDGIEAQYGNKRE